MGVTDQTTPRHRLSLGRQLFFALVTIAAILLLLELSCRLSPFGGRPAPVGLTHGAITLDPVLHHVWTPGYRGIDNSREEPYELVINRQSWVEAYDIDPIKPPGCFRIFYVGDSNTQGVVPAGKRMADLVEVQLNRRYAGSGRRFEVVNTGTSSYSPMLYYLVIRERILKYAPDLIVINVDMTDCVNDFGYALQSQHDTTGRLVAVSAIPGAPPHYRMTPRGLVRLGPLGRTVDWLGRRSVLVTALQRAIGQSPIPSVLAESQPESEADWLAQNWTPAISANVERSLRYLGETWTLLRDHHVKMVVTGVPHYPQFTGRWSARPHQALAEAAATYGFPFFDSFEPLEPAVIAAPADRYYWQSDPTHFNAAGNALWAEVQLKALSDPPLALLPPLPR